MSLADLYTIWSSHLLKQHIRLWWRFSRDMDGTNNLANNFNFCRFSYVRWVLVSWQPTLHSPNFSSRASLSFWEVTWGVWQNHFSSFREPRVLLAPKTTSARKIVRKCPVCQTGKGQAQNTGLCNSPLTVPKFIWEDLPILYAVGWNRLLRTWLTYSSTKLVVCMAFLNRKKKEYHINLT